MSRRSTGPVSVVGRFTESYERWETEEARLVEAEVIGAAFGANGYTTVDQADGLTEHLALGPGMKLLDVGSGRGWPGLYLAKKAGCEAVLTDLPAVALRSAATTARRKRLRRRCAFVLAGGAALPFRRRVFDAIVHTDVLC